MNKPTRTAKEIEEKLQIIRDAGYTVTCPNGYIMVKNAAGEIEKWGDLPSVWSWFQDLPLMRLHHDLEADHHFRQTIKFSLLAIGLAGCAIFISTHLHPLASAVAGVAGVVSLVAAIIHVEHWKQNKKAAFGG